MRIFLSICLLASLALAEDIVLKTQKGNVRGKRVDAEMGAYYYSFRGIRYAQAPTGKLRFKVRSKWLYWRVMANQLYFNVVIFENEVVMYIINCYIFLGSS